MKSRCINSIPYFKESFFMFRAFNVERAGLSCFQKKILQYILSTFIFIF